jgi:hypothetical protein
MFWYREYTHSCAPGLAFVWIPGAYLVARITVNLPLTDIREAYHDHSTGPYTFFLRYKKSPTQAFIEITSQGLKGISSPRQRPGSARPSLTFERLVQLLD